MDYPDGIAIGNFRDTSQCLLFRYSFAVAVVITCFAVLLAAFFVETTSVGKGRCGCDQKSK
jgi:hypothetical protein